jgi:hypothetical protein
MGDFQFIEIPESETNTRLLKIPAALACYWLGRSELEAS